jgi:hypothetical protein
MSIGRISLGDPIKWIVLGIIGIIFLAIFFMYFGEWFIPLALMLAIILSMWFTGAYKNLPSWVLIVAPLTAFCLGYVMQKLTIVSLSTTGGEVSSTIPAIGYGLVAVVLVVLLFVFVKPRYVRKR